MVIVANLVDGACSQVSDSGISDADVVFWDCECCGEWVGYVEVSLSSIFHMWMTANVADAVRLCFGFHRISRMTTRTILRCSGIEYRLYELLCFGCITWITCHDYSQLISYELVRSRQQFSCIAMPGLKIFVTRISNMAAKNQA